MTRVSSSRAVLRYMRTKNGQIENYADIAEALRLSPPTVNSALARIVRNHPEYGIRRIGSGQYLFKADLVNEATATVKESEPKQLTPGDLFEFVGSFSNGELVIRNPSDNRLYKLTEL